MKRTPTAAALLLVGVLAAERIGRSPGLNALPRLRDSWLSALT